MMSRIVSMGHLPGLGWLGSSMMSLYRLVRLRPVRVSATSSTAFFAEPLAPVVPEPDAE